MKRKYKSPKEILLDKLQERPDLKELILWMACDWGVEL
jgi:hypothetical protein